MSVLFHQQGGGTNGHFAWIRIRLFFFIWIRILKSFQKNSKTAAFEKIQMFCYLKVLRFEIDLYKCVTEFSDGTIYFFFFNSSVFSSI